MIEYTPDQVLFVENFTNKRDELTLEVGLLTHEKEQLLNTNKDLAEINASLQKGIDEMNANSAQLGFEQAEKVNALRLEHTTLVEEIETLKTKKELLNKDLEEKAHTINVLGMLINSIRTATEDTTTQIKNMSNQLGVFTGKVESAAITISHEADRVKTMTDELSTVIDSERKANYEKSREIDNRENAVINRERLADIKYREIIKESSN